MRKMLLAAAALAVALAASAQEPKFDFRRDSTRTSGFTLPDSLAHMSPWKPDYKTMAPVRSCAARARAETWKTQGRISPAILYILGIMSRSP